MLFPFGTFKKCLSTDEINAVVKEAEAIAVTVFTPIAMGPLLSEAKQRLFASLNALITNFRAVNQSLSQECCQRALQVASAHLEQREKSNEFTSFEEFNTAQLLVIEAFETAVKNKGVARDDVKQQFLDAMSNYRQQLYAKFKVSEAEKAADAANKAYLDEQEARRRVEAEMSEKLQRQAEEAERLKKSFEDESRVMQQRISAMQSEAIEKEKAMKVRIDELIEQGEYERAELEKQLSEQMTAKLNAQQEGFDEQIKALNQATEALQKEIKDKADEVKKLQDDLSKRPTVTEIHHHHESGGGGCIIC
jgi:hypothetical protein